MLLNSTQSSFLSSIHLCVFFLSPFLSVSAAARSARFFFLFSNLTIFPGFYFLFSLSVCLFPFRRFVLPLLRDFFFVFCFFCCIYHVLSPVRLSHIFCMCVCVCVCVLLLSLSGCLICMLSSSAYWADAILFSAASNSF